tara:strand:- start:196 stop:729 length:534 start_codon:yes stop_codon:yes gene_type:complete
VKGFTIILLGVIFAMLLAGSFQSISADHELPGNSIFYDQTRENTIYQNDSKYRIFLQVEIRTADGQLISFTESSHGSIIPHEITEHVFNEKLGKIEIVTIDNIKYEKVQYTLPGEIKDLLKNSQTYRFINSWAIIICGEVEGHEQTCLRVFSAMTSSVFVTENDIGILHWTILRIIE